MLTPSNRKTWLPLATRNVVVHNASRCSHNQLAPAKEMDDCVLDRRSLMGMLGASLILTGSAFCPPRSGAFTLPPPGFRLHNDRLDGYSFLYPEDWVQVTSSGNDIFLRNPFKVDQNVFVDVSSPSSSRYESVTALGAPEEAAERILDQYLNKEFMSTRIGIKRTGEVVSASSRTGSDGNQYYDVQVRLASYGSRNPYVATQEEVMKDYGLEWDRQLITTLGVANQRLYELRLQTSSDTFDQDKNMLSTIQKSFSCREVEAT